MALCIHCHTWDKGFFAPRCSECNQEVGFLLQCFTSLLWVVATAVFYYFGMLGAWWLIKYMLGF